MQDFKEVKDYEELHSLTNHPGFNVLLTLLDSQLESIGNIRQIENADQLHFRRGQTDVMDFIIHLRKFAENMVEHLNREAEDESFE
jgi:hypothetical protein